MAPTPKPPGQRRRERPERPQWRTLPVGGRKGKPPTLPGAKQLGKPARDWWSAVWRSPMAGVFLEADVPALIRAARLVAKEAAGEASASELSELRQLEDRFGLSPLARRRLQWEVEAAAAPEAKRPAHAQDRRARLRSVS